jgi:integrase
MASIREVSGGKWQAQLRHRGMRPVCKTFHTKTEATRWARQLESEFDRGLYVDRTEAERTTLGELIERYLVEVTPLKKSARNEAQRLKFLKRHFGMISLAALRPTHIAEFRDARLKAGLSGSSVVKEMNSLAHVVDIAIMDWGIPLHSNPAKLVRRPKVSRGRDRRLLPDEEARLFVSCGNSNARMLLPIVRFAIETAMRLGEILSLEWRNIDLAQRIATLLDTKTGDARQVPLSTAALSAISSLPRHLKDGRVFWAWSRADSLEHAWLLMCAQF